MCNQKTCAAKYSENQVINTLFTKSLGQQQQKHMHAGRLLRKCMQDDCCEKKKEEEKKAKKILTYQITIFTVVVHFISYYTMHVM